MPIARTVGMWLVCRMCRLTRLIGFWVSLSGFAINFVSMMCFTRKCRLVMLLSGFAMNFRLVVCLPSFAMNCWLIKILSCFAVNCKPIMILSVSCSVLHASNDFVLFFFLSLSPFFYELQTDDEILLFCYELRAGNVFVLFCYVEPMQQHQECN